MLHWHTHEGFRSLVAAARLRTAPILNERGEPAAPDDLTFAFWLQQA